MPCYPEALEFCHQIPLSRGENFHWPTCGTVGGNLCNWLHTYSNGGMGGKSEEEARNIIWGGLYKLVGSSISAQEANDIWLATGLPGLWTGDNTAPEDMPTTTTKLVPTVSTTPTGGGPPQPGGAPGGGGAVGGDALAFLDGFMPDVDRNVKLLGIAALGFFLYKRAKSKKK